MLQNLTTQISILDVRLLQAFDKRKDQTFFLATVSQVVM